jgi:hypothetical protein
LSPRHNVDAVGLTQVAVFGAAILTLLALPRVLVARRSVEETLARRRDWRRRPVEETQALRELDRALQHRDVGPVLDDAPAEQIDDIARELRRLHRQRRGGPACESERWLAAVLEAYDDRLCRACRCVGVPEHLEPLEGLDREIERVRVEGALQAAGVALR